MILPFGETSSDKNFKSSEISNGDSFGNYEIHLNFTMEENLDGKGCKLQLASEFYNKTYGFRLSQRFKPECVNEPEYSGMKLGEASSVKMVFKARPKSDTLASSCSDISTFRAAKSLWITFWDSRYSIPLQVSRANLIWSLLVTNWRPLDRRYSSKLPFDMYSVTIFNEDLSKIIPSRKVFTVAEYFLTASNAPTVQ